MAARLLFRGGVDQRGRRDLFLINQAADWSKINPSVPFNHRNEGVVVEGKLAKGGAKSG